MKGIVFNLSVFIGCMIGCVYLRRNEPEPPDPIQQVQPPPVPSSEPQHDEEPVFDDDELVEV